MQEIQSLSCFLLSPYLTKCAKKGHRELEFQMREISVTLFHSDSVPGTASWPPTTLTTQGQDLGPQLIHDNI